MPRAKISAGLQQELYRANGPEMLDIVVELAPLKYPLTRHRVLSARRESLIRQQEMFKRKSIVVENIIHEQGGRVLGRAWISRTLKARVPARSVKTISNLSDVFNLDVLHLVKID